jgi:hypothetical protein
MITLMVFSSHTESGIHNPFAPGQYSSNIGSRNLLNGLPGLWKNGVLDTEAGFRSFNDNSPVVSTSQ